MRVATAATRVALSAFLLFPLFPDPARAQAPAGGVPAAYEVKRGDTLFAVARRLRLDGVTLHQAVLALYRANPDAFNGASINQLRVDSVLTIPSRESMAAVGASEAAQEVMALSAARPALAAEPRPAQVPQTAAIVPAPAPVAAPRLDAGRDHAERRYKEGLALERRGDDKGALAAFLEAGEAGNGPAQKKLGEIYDRGTPAAPRDYQTSLKWYQKARDQGVAVPRPEIRVPVLR